jgi:hypothetical protein
MTSLRSLVLLVAVAAVLAGCGDDEGSTTPAPPPQEVAGATGRDGESARRERGSRSRRARGEDGKRFSSPRELGGGGSDRDGAAKLPSPAQTRAKYTKGAARVVYHEARLRCLTQPRTTLANVYGVEADDTAGIAAGYARRESPAPQYRRAVYDGCLDGLSTNPRKII